MPCYCSPPKRPTGFLFFSIFFSFLFLNMKPLSEVAPGLLVIQIPIQAMCTTGGLVFFSFYKLVDQYFQCTLMDPDDKNSCHIGHGRLYRDVHVQAKHSTEVGKAPLIHFQKISFKKGFLQIKSSQILCMDQKKFLNPFCFACTLGLLPCLSKKLNEYS